MMRHIAVLMSVIMLTLGNIYAADIKLLTSVPENNSEISSFDIKLTFDISDAVSELGNENIGIGYTGSTRGISTYLYEGTEESGTLIANVMTAMFYGSSDSKNSVTFPIPVDLIPTPGQTYTLVCKNQFRLYDLETSKAISSVPSIQYNKTPLVLTFIGKAASSSELVLQSSSISNNEDLKTISELAFEYNEEMALSQNKGIDIYNGEELVASSKLIEIDSTNPKVLRATFDDVALYLGNQYTIKLPEGIVSLKNNSTIVNKPVEIKVNGASTISLSTKSVSIENNSVVLPKDISIRFNLEDGQTLTPPGNVYHKRWINLYKGEISEDNLIKKLNGTAQNDGISWDLSTVSFEPNTKYVLELPPNGITVWINGTEAPAYGSEEVAISFTTPSVEDLNLSPITVGAAKIGRFDDDASPDFVNGGTYAHINTIEIKRVEYTLNGEVVKPNLNINGDHNAFVYDVTDGSRKLVKEIIMSADGRGGDDDGGIIIRDYSVFIINTQMDFLESHSYEIVIPKGTLRLNSVEYPSWYNYVMNDEIVYTVKGATPSEFKVESCSVENNAEFSVLPPAIVWTLNGAYSLKSANSTANVVSSGTVIGNNKLPMTINIDGTKSYVAVHLIDTKTGNGRAFRNGQIYTVTIPAGTIVYPGDESLTNPELTVTLNGIEAEKPKAEMVNVNLTVNGLHTTAHQSPKGEAYSFNFKPASEWVVESVKHGNKVLDENADGMFVTDPLNQDAELTAELKYNGPWADYSETTGVWTVKDSNIRIYSDNQHIVVEGVTPDNEINVYSVSGLHINSTRVADNHDCVRITVAPGQVYIVTVDGKAAKIQM